MSIEITGRWEELIARPELRGHRVRVTVLDNEAVQAEHGAWLESLRRLASNGVRVARPADDSRESVY